MEGPIQQQQQPIAQASTPEYQEPAMRIAFSLLKKWRCQMNRDDVQGMVGIALVKAAQQFDPSHGTKFESFLFYYIKAELIKTIEGAVKAKKAIEALRDVTPEFGDLNGQSNQNKSKNDEQVLPDPDRISASPSINPEKKMILEERNELVRQALTRIDEKHRDILEFIYFQQMHPQEIKEKLGLSRSGIKSALRKAKQALEEELLNSGF